LVSDLRSNSLTTSTDDLDRLLLVVKCLAGGGGPTPRQIARIIGESSSRVSSDCRILHLIGWVIVGADSENPDNPILYPQLSPGMHTTLFLVQKPKR